jgi:hypothetical protein
VDENHDGRFALATTAAVGRDLEADADGRHAVAVEDGGDAVPTADRLEAARGFEEFAPALCESRGFLVDRAGLCLGYATVMGRLHPLEGAFCRTPAGISRRRTGKRAIGRGPCLGLTGDRRRDAETGRQEEAKVTSHATFSLVLERAAKPGAL